MPFCQDSVGLLNLFSSLVNRVFPSLNHRIVVFLSCSCISLRFPDIFHPSFGFENYLLFKKKKRLPRISFFAQFCLHTSTPPHNVMSAQCLDCQGDESQASRGKGGSNHDSLSLPPSLSLSSHCLLLVSLLVVSFFAFLSLSFRAHL